MENLEFLASESLCGFAKTVVSWFRLTTNNNKYCDKTRENLALLAPNTENQLVREIYLAPILHPSCTQPRVGLGCNALVFRSLRLKSLKIENICEIRDICVIEPCLRAFFVSFVRFVFEKISV